MSPGSHPVESIASEYGIPTRQGRRHCPTSGCLIETTDRDLTVPRAHAPANRSLGYAGSARVCRNHSDSRFSAETTRKPPSRGICAGVRSGSPFQRAPLRKVPSRCSRMTAAPRIGADGAARGGAEDCDPDSEEVRERRAGLHGSDPIALLRGDRGRRSHEAHFESLPERASDPPQGRHRVALVVAVFQARNL